MDDKPKSSTEADLTLLLDQLDGTLSSETIRDRIAQIDAEITDLYRRRNRFEKLLELANGKSPEANPTPKKSRKTTEGMVTTNGVVYTPSKGRPSAVEKEITKLLTEPLPNDGRDLPLLHKIIGFMKTYGPCRISIIVKALGVEFNEIMSTMMSNKSIFKSNAKVGIPAAHGEWSLIER